MKSQVRFLIRIMVVLMIPLLMVTGCAKRDAQKALTQAQQAKDEAQQAQAPGYVITMFTEANRLLNLAQSHFDAGDYQKAIDTSNMAQSQFIQAKEAVPKVKERVDAQIAQIEAGLTAAETNVQNARDQGGTVLTAEEITAVADQASKVREEYETTYRSEVDEEKLNAFIARVNDVQTQTESLANAHLKPAAIAAKDEIMTLITQAQELKGDVHAPEKYGQVQTQLQELEKDEQAGQWQAMSDLAAQMKSPLQEIITVAQEKAAGDILKDLLSQVQQARALQAQDVSEYAGNIDQAEAAVKQGQSALSQQQYAEAITAANDAKAALDRAAQALGTAAQGYIQTAQANLDQAIQNEAEQYAPQIVAQLREAIAGVQELLQAQKFNAAYAAGQKAAEASKGAIDAGRRGKAQLSIAKVEQPFSILHSQGGASYAPEAYQKALATIQTLRNMLKAGEYESVVAGESDAVKVVQESLASLAASSAEYIQKANAALTDAQEAQAPKVVALQYANAVNFKDAAQKELGSQRYLAAIQKSEFAIQAAQEAENRAYQLQAEQNLREADRDLALAEKAGQKTLSPLEYRQALEARKETLDQINQRQYKAAFKRSGETKTLSDQALNNLVYKAQDQVDAALTAQAITYSPPEITQAMTLLTQAEEAQAAQQFDAANEKAQESEKLAAQAEFLTWKQRSYSLLKNLEGSQPELDANQAPKYTPALYRMVLDNIAEAKVKQIDEDYKSSFQHADKANETKKQIYSTMHQDLERALAELNKTADWLGENAMDAEGREIKISLLNVVTEMKRQIDLEDWPAAHVMAEKAAVEAQKASALLESRNRQILAYQLQESLQPYAKQNALFIVPEQAQQFDQTLETLVKPAEGDTYGKAHTVYQQAAEAVQKLPESIMNSANQRTDEVAAILQQAQQAGARKYYPDWYRELVSDLQWLRNSVRGEDFKGIADHLKKLETESNRLLVATQVASAEDDYLQALDINLEQMSNVIQKLGFIAQMPARLIIAAKTTEHKLDPVVTDMYRSMQGEMNAHTVRINAELLEERAKDLQPPATLVSLHRKAITAFEHFRKAAHGFEIYGESKTYDLLYRERLLEEAYNHLNKTLKINEDLRFAIDSHRRMSGFEKLDWNIKRWQDKAADWYLDWNVNK